MQRTETIFILILLMALSYSASGQVSDDSIKSYNESIEKYRTGKNIRMLYTESTPLKPEQQRSFEGLNYFPPDIGYCVEGKLVKEEEQLVVIMKTSTERAPEYIRVGTVSFELKGEQFVLAAFQSKKLLEVNPGDSSLFIPFRDGTSGIESYGGGRYVDCVIPEKGDGILIDFNKAYNPYCAYNPRYSCVIPPGENRLEIRIEAGEMIFEKH